MTGEINNLRRTNTTRCTFIPGTSSAVQFQPLFLGTGGYGYLVSGLFTTSGISVIGYYYYKRSTKGFIKFTTEDAFTVEFFKYNLSLGTANT